MNREILDAILKELKDGTSQAEILHLLTEGEAHLLPKQQADDYLQQALNEQAENSLFGADANPEPALRNEPAMIEQPTIVEPPTEPSTVTTAEVVAGVNPVVEACGDARSENEGAAVSRNAPIEESKFEKFVLYDEEDSKHRDRQKQRIYYNDFIFLRGPLASTANDAQEKYFQTFGRYPIGVVKTGQAIQDAYFPSKNTDDYQEKKWITKARSLKRQADLEDLKYAEWPALIPIEDILLPVDKLDPMMLPAGVRAWFANVSYRMSVPLDFTAICGLTVLAGVLGRRVFVYPKAKDREWKESICLSGCVISESGTIKTPTWKVFTNPITEIDALLSKKHKTEMEAYKTVLANLKTQNKERAKTQNNLPPLEPPPAPEARQRVILNDVTPEKMQDILADNPCGILYYRDELYGWVSELEKKERELQRGIFLAAMNGDDTQAADRIGREGKTAKMCASVFGSFQPELFRDFLGARRNVNDGTMARFPLMCWPDDQEVTEFVDDTADSFLRDSFRRIARFFAKMKEESVSLHFTQEAQQVFDKWRVKMASQIKKEKDLGKCSHLSKYNGSLPKIAGLFQMIDLAIEAMQFVPDQQNVNLKSGEKTSVPAEVCFSGARAIDLEHLQMAIRFLSYLESHMNRCYGSVRRPYMTVVLKLVDLIKEGKLENGLNARDIDRKYFGAHKKEVVDCALDELVEKNWLRAKFTQAWTGRGCDRYEVNPDARLSKD